MRRFALSLLLAWFASSAVLAASPVVLPNPANGSLSPSISPAPLGDSEKSYGVKEETPNQRRQREGLPIVASYPPLEYGERLETPNQRRRRLGLPIPGEPVIGSSEETPNHRRQRLALATTKAL